MTLGGLAVAGNLCCNYHSGPGKAVSRVRVCVCVQTITIELNDLDLDICQAGSY